MTAANPINSPAFDRVVDALERAGMKQQGRSWTCPAHEDRSPSLSVTAKDGKCLVCCFAGCDPEAIVSALGLCMADLFDDRRTGGAQGSTRAKTKASEPRKPLRVYRNLDEVREAVERSTGGKVVDRYDYEDEQRNVVLCVFRTDPKDFRQATPEGDGWKLSTAGARLVPFRLPELRSAIEAGDSIHIVEGEKDVLAIEAAMGIATCNPMGAGKPLEQYAEHFRGADLVRIVADRDEPGRKHARAWAEVLRPIAKRVELVEPIEGKDAADARAAGHDLDSAFARVDEPEDPTGVRFSDEQTRIAFVFESPPKKREMLVEEFMPAHESGLLAARGGAGKGHFQMAATIALGLGEPFAGFEVKRPRGVVMVSAEDDHEELHRRMIAALTARFGEMDDERKRWVRDQLERRVRIVNLRGAVGIGLGDELRERILRVVGMVDDPGLIWLDPIGRLLPPGSPPGFLNSQEGAGRVVAEFDALRSATGCSVFGAAHVNKAAIRDDGELSGAAVTGSLQLVDFSRWVLALKPLTSREAADSALFDGRYVEAGLTKTNYTAEFEKRLVFRRVEGGALVHVEAKSRTELADEHMLTALLANGTWTTRERWSELAKERFDLSKHKADEARSRLVLSGRVVDHEVREGRSAKKGFAPAPHLRMTSWPLPPKRIADIDGGEGE